MKMDYGLLQKQKLLMSQTQIQSLGLLNMCNIELNLFLNNEYIDNPLLEHQEGEGPDGLAENLQIFPEPRYNFQEGYGHGDKEETSPIEYTAKEKFEDIQIYLKEQMDVKLYSSQEWELIDFLIQNLDDNGFYSMSVEETALISKKPKYMVSRCLEDLRQLEPFGIFAENLNSCLLRQLEAAGLEDDYIKVMITDHLEDISSGKISNISRHLKLPTAKVRKYIAFIRTLNPRPMSGFGTSNNMYVIPDILFLKRNNKWEITINDSWMGNYQLNDYYMHMISVSKDEELQEYFSKKLERARFILQSIEQRRKTILSISARILEVQRSFFEGGELKPMTMAELAGGLDIHPSTVSRAVSKKYIQYPGGTILMKSLFTAGVTNESGEPNMTADQIKRKIRDLINGENSLKPYSDQSLSNLLKDQGITLSRRGVAKYRAEMGIRDSMERKCVL